MLMNFSDMMQEFFEDAKQIQVQSNSTIGAYKHLPRCSEVPDWQECTTEEDFPTADVFLTVHKRGHTLKSQLEAVALQSLHPTRLFIVQNEIHVNVQSIVDEWRNTTDATYSYPIDIVSTTINSRYHGRFYFAYAMSTASYVSVWDDDVLPGPEWLRYVIEYSLSHNNSLIGGDGRTYERIFPEHHCVQQGERNTAGPIDFAIQAYTLRREFLRFYLGAEPLTYATGEDIQLAWALQRHGIPAYLPPYEGNYSFKTFGKVGSDKHASWKHSPQQPRHWLLCKLLEQGFQPLSCQNCNQENAAACLKNFSHFEDAPEMSLQGTTFHCHPRFFDKLKEQQSRLSIKAAQKPQGAIRAPETGQEGENALSQKAECPLVFGLGHQKSGTTTVVKALGSYANVPARSDVVGFSFQNPLMDEQVLDLINPEYGQIQKEGFGLQYASQMARLCPNMKWYIVQRDMFDVVRSVSDRLGLTGTSKCPQKIPKGAWGHLFKGSNDTACVVRIAKHYIRYEERLFDFEASLPQPIPKIKYEDYVADRIGSLGRLCKSLGVLGSCPPPSSAKLDTSQYQKQGANRFTPLTELWSPEVLNELTALNNTRLQYLDVTQMSPL